eukprot:gene1117-2176_t
MLKRNTFFNSEEFHNLNYSQTTQCDLKIAICGGGIGGLFLGYSLQRKGFDVTLFEKKTQFSKYGGPIQIASNALSCIKAVDSQLFYKIMERFTFTGTRKCGIKDGVRNSWYCVFSAIKFLAEWNNLPYTGVIDRPDLQEILLSLMVPGTVVNNMAIERYIEHQDGTVDIQSSSSSHEQIYKGFDVVVGADGIWSSIRRQMWNESSERQRQRQRPGTALYSGYTLFAAEVVIPPDSIFFHSDSYFNTGYKAYIGPNKYFVTSDVGGGRIQWYAFLGLPPNFKTNNNNHNNNHNKEDSSHSDSDSDSNSDMEFLIRQYKDWSPEILACLTSIPVEIIERRDLYDRPPSWSRSWSTGHVTMLGDAVHAMLPTLGQGGCQAIEDAYVLTECLCRVQDKREIPSALQEYYRKRILRTSIIQAMSRFSSDMVLTAFSTPFSMTECLQECIDRKRVGDYKYLNLKSIMSWIMQIFLPLCFFIQFNYLYAFQPSTIDSKDLLNLVNASFDRNKEELKRVHSTLREGHQTFFDSNTMCYMQYNIKTKEISKVLDAADALCAVAGIQCCLILSLKCILRKIHRRRVIYQKFWENYFMFSYCVTLLPRNSQPSKCPPSQELA